MQYLARCQSLLQQGRFVGDALYFCGENAPATNHPREPALPPGYAFDSCNVEILGRLKVEDGRLLLPNGAGYRVLILPAHARTMTPETLRRIKELVTQGAVVVGPKPERAPGLSPGQDNEAEFRALTTEIWADCDGRTVTQHALGKGRVSWGQPLPEVFAASRTGPDFSCADARDLDSLRYIHRTIGEADVYFISNQLNRARVVRGSFRVSGKAAEIWSPDTGRMAPAISDAAPDGARTLVELDLDPAGSAFVVFRPAKPGQEQLRGVSSTPLAGSAPGGDPAAEKSSAPTPAARAGSPQPPHVLTITSAVYEAADGAGKVDVTEKLRGLISPTRTLDLRPTTRWRAILPRCT